MPDDRYPKRPPFFAHKYCRLLFKACVANEIGPVSTLLLVCVVLTEDAAHFRRAVTYFNMQLAPLLGLTSAAALIEARNRAVASGWLYYESGGTHKAGKYWVTVPAHASGLDDFPTDEGIREAEIIQRELNNPETIHDQRNTSTNINAIPTPTLTLKPINPVPIPAPVPESSLIKSPKFDSEVVDQIYMAYPRHISKEKALKAIADALKKVTAAELLAAVIEYARCRRLPGMDQQFTPHPATWFNSGRWQDDRAEWTRPDNLGKPNGSTAANSTRTRDPERAEQRKRIPVVQAGAARNGQDGVT